MVRKLKREYPVSPQLVHVRQCIHEQLTVRGNQVFYEKWLFRPDEFQCPTCKTSKNVVFMRVDILNNVVRSCTYCGFTEPIYARNPDTDADQAILIESRIVASSTEIVDFVKRNNIQRQFLHPVVFNLLKTQARKSIEEIEAEIEE